ncbi:MAG: GDP-mannose 4,6-dehydratase [Chryseolinea sp.]
MNALIFGISGQDGYYLSSILRNSGINVIGISRSVGGWLSGDVGDADFVEKLVKEYQPSYIFHLAANSTTAHHAIFENHRAICTGSINILENVYRHNRSCKVFLSGSALQFVNTGAPIHESDPFEARDAYSLSRINSVNAARYFRQLGISAYVGYFFHHDSPYRSERHLNMKIARAVKRISLGSSESIVIGDLEVVKEFNFAGDLMQAVWTLVNQTNSFEAMIGSGNGYPIRDWVNACFERVGGQAGDSVVQRLDFKRDFDSLVANPSTLKALGWQPQVGLSELAALMIGQ